MESETHLVFVFLSAVVLLSIIVALFGCVCGCRKTVPKNELMGLAGMVKLTNPDENVNFSAPPPVVQLNSVVVAADQLANQASEINKRPNNTVSSATRSLPDLPVESERLRVTRSTDVLWEANEPNGDTSSELYATVDDNKTGGRAGRQNTQLPRDLTIESSYDSPSQTDNSLSPYARVKREHPYDQVKQSEEHPYAQVRANGKAGTSVVSNSNLLQSASTSSVDGPDSPVAPPRTRKSISLSESSLAPTIDIPAATAIAGGIPANHELPYMTPPIPANSQQHFSGDSQDSSKGYTSISVREPLSSILGQVPRRQELVDSHYATVSDDSDEMYAAIEEPNQAVYTSGSETYAQIRPMGIVVTASINPVRTENLQPPAHSLNNTKNHSRQESSSSAGSSSATPASPKPEKRQANSPLPEPPPLPTLASAATVDDMYAKVIKKRRSSHSVSSVDLNENPVTPVVMGYETVLRSHSPQASTSVIPGYEMVSGQDCNINATDGSSAGYETVSGEHDSLVPGYERVSGGRLSDCDPNYEELKPHDLTYAVVNKKRRKLSQLSSSEPDYASLSRKDPGYERVEGFEPNYESVSRVSHDSDPNYESVERQEPPYERVKAGSRTSSYASTNSHDNNNIHPQQTEDVYSKVNKQRTVR